METEPATLDGGAHLLVVTGELDLNTVGGLRRRLDGAFANGRARLVVDLSDTAYIDSSGLAELLRAHRKALEAGGRLALVVTASPLRRTLEIRGLDGVFAIAPTRGEAAALV